MRPEEFAQFKRRMEELGIKVTNSTPKDSRQNASELLPFGSERFREWYGRQESSREAEREED